MVEVFGVTDGQKVEYAVDFATGDSTTALVKVRVCPMCGGYGDCWPASGAWVYAPPPVPCDYCAGCGFKLSGVERE